MPTVPDRRDRVPPGQRVTERFPVLHHGPVLHLDRDRWRLLLYGLVGREVELRWEDFRALERVTVRCDIHCVTRWSKLDTEWAGVSGKTVADLAKPKPEARYVLLGAPGGWNTNLPLEDLVAENVLFADTYDGREITDEHGGPVRLVVPHLYFWKSAKWVTTVEFIEHDRPGFWERAGYHMRGDPWREERHAE